MIAPQGFGWGTIVRLGLVQTALGAIVVLLTSTLNRVMVVELALPAALPGGLVALHYAVQALRPRWGYGSDLGRRRTPWIVGGMALLALGGTGAALGTALVPGQPSIGFSLLVLSFLAVGIGVGAAGTSLLVLLSTGVAPHRRGAAATIVWIMMIAGFVVTAPTAGHLLDPFSGERLVAVSGGVSLIAFLVALLALWGVEPPRARAPERPGPARPFAKVLAEVWAEPEARRFTVFVFLAMLAYSAQELILEPFAGLVFALSPGATTKLSGLQNGGVLAGMVLVALVTANGRGRLASLRLWTIAGCLGSAAALVAIAACGFAGPGAPLRACIAGLGLFNGMFAVAAIGSMMALAGHGGAPDGESRHGTRMGVWGAAQGIAFGLGGFLGAAGVDLARLAFGTVVPAYAAVFVIEAALFLVAAGLAARIGRPAMSAPPLGSLSVRHAV
ncbi:bacteriochlorophyll synthase [Methylobacterium indicum]|uniref:BCD family MFS transporter n=1 Tax=Methylobacterium indicum TaxID=1775910 RepID=UPI0007347A80|nr:BCD family MFS transporter [Methylobacterium indicum]KTS38712.1 bacteriochlorophyll synthase [Methylobacterium indicum]KTS38943.1 bacteriochlorophyll synthase [Methylobacterium indicum]KTS54929.1 bacteriochlorophyll synthase [Methylobacterium indicum]